MQQYVLYSRFLPTKITRAFGEIHGRVMHLFYAIKSSDSVSDPRHYLAQLLKPGDVYVDIGASFGTTVRIAVIALGKQGKIYAFEPQTHVFQQLDQMIQRFGWDTVTPFQTLVGDYTGECVLYENPKNSQVSSLSPTWSALQSTPVSHPITMLDDWAASHHVETVDFIKIDVEGAELLVLRGARQMLKTNKPTLLMEINGRKRRSVQFGYTIDDLLSELRQVGYHRFEVLCPQGLLCFESESDLSDSDFDMIARADRPEVD